RQPAPPKRRGAVRGPPLGRRPGAPPCHSAVAGKSLEWPPGGGMPSKRFLFVSYEGLIADVAWQGVKEGQEVRLWIRDAAEQQIAEGFVPKSQDWKADADWADVVVFDDVLGMGEMAEGLRKTGKLVVGGSPYTDKLEDDRAFGQQELKAAGVAIIPQENFTSFDDAIR